jgi:hypothetical protein
MLRPALALVALAGLTAAQDTLAVPQLSPPAEHTWTVGVTEVNVAYHAPSVRGREIFGSKVPYDVVWRAGANSNTTVTFQHDVSVEGHAVPAGTYGVHMIPGPGEWTVILSKDSTAWGSYRYREENDAMRAVVQSEQRPHRERLEFVMDDVEMGAATLALHWGETYVPVRVEIDLGEVVLAPVREAHAKGDENPGWQYWFQAAEYGRDYDVDPEELLSWTDRSCEIQKTFSNLWTQSELLAEVGRVEEAGAAREAALERVTVDELSSLGRRYANRDDNEAAAAIYEMVVQMGSPNWWVYTQIATVREKLGDTKGALEALEQALTKGVDPVTEAEITANIERLTGRATG